MRRLKAAQAQIIEKEKLEQELRTARRIQQSILPMELPRLPGYDFGATILSARTVGGDLYDFIPLGEGRLGIAVGDVSDKSVPAAIFMALTRSLLRAEATRSVVRPPSPRQALQRVNKLLLDMNDAGMFVTLLYGILDGPRRTFSYPRAGHELPLIVHASATHAVVGKPIAPSVPCSLDSVAACRSVCLTTRGLTKMSYASRLTTPCCCIPMAPPTSPIRGMCCTAWIGCRRQRAQPPA